MAEITVILTSYNYAKYLGKAIDSVINQSYSDWQLIIIDDGSKDSSIDIINNYVNQFPEKIYLYTHPDNENRGIKSTYELAFSLAEGKYTAFLESDDFWNEGYLEKKTEAIKQRKNVSLVYSGLELVGEAHQRYIDFLDYLDFVGHRINKKPSRIFESLFYRNPVSTFSNIFVRTEVLNDFSIKKDFEIWADWQLLLCAAEKGDFYYIPEKLVNWRIHSNSTNQKFEAENDVVFLQKSFMRGMLNGNLRLLAREPKFFTTLFHNIAFFFHSPGVVLRKIQERF